MKLVIATIPDQTSRLLIELEDGPQYGKPVHQGTLKYNRAQNAHESCPKPDMVFHNVFPDTIAQQNTRLKKQITRQPHRIPHTLVVTDHVHHDRHC